MTWITYKQTACSCDVDRYGRTLCHFYCRRTIVSVTVYTGSTSLPYKTGTGDGDEGIHSLEGF